MRQTGRDKEGEQGRWPQRKVRRGRFLCPGSTVRSPCRQNDPFAVRCLVLQNVPWIGVEKSRGFRSLSILLFCSPSWSAEGLFPALLPSYLEDGELWPGSVCSNPAIETQPLSTENTVWAVVQELTLGHPNLELLSEGTGQSPCPGILWDDKFTRPLQ